MVESVGAARGRRVVSRRLIRKVREGEAIRVEQRRSEPPRLIGTPWGGIEIFDLMVVVIMSTNHTHHTLACTSNTGCERHGGIKRQ